MKPRFNGLVATALFLAAIPAAHAHPGLEPASGFTGGLAHPFSGWDHILAMLAVGFWAAQMRAPRLLPAAFLLAMALGAVAGHWTGPVPGVEQAIAASVLLLGLMIARRARMPAAAAAACVGAFAVLHGAAHGAEMPASAGAMAYGSGFVAATAILLAAGVASERLAARLPAPASRAPGWAFAAAGFVLLAMAAAIRP
ncbi:MAG TPA: HupE/UreJ family protein [Opitutaceae bacterium]|nr:HupE/UreJ family protein [Opitutaceae bacterium]